MPKVTGSAEKKCPRCAEMVKVDAHVCRFCQYEFEASQVASPAVQKKRGARAALGCLFVLLLIIAVAVIMTQLTQPGGSLASSALGVDTQLQNIKDKVAIDAVKQYDIAKSGGTLLDRCSQAQLVAAAYLQAQNQASYDRWKQTVKEDCDAAGLKF